MLPCHNPVMRAIDADIAPTYSQPIYSEQPIRTSERVTTFAFQERRAGT